MQILHDDQEWPLLKTPLEQIVRDQEEVALELLRLDEDEARVAEVHTDHVAGKWRGVGDCSGIQT